MIPVVIRAAVTVVAGESRPSRPAWVTPAQARRMDPLAALIAAAVDGLPRAVLTADSAIVVGTAWGSVHSTVTFMDGLAQWGDAVASPASFTTSVHHHATGILGELLAIHGPTATISNGALSGLGALRWAQGIIAGGRAASALVAAADLPNAWSRRITCELSRCPFPIGGGATVLLLTAGGQGWTIAQPGLVPPAVLAEAGGATPAEERIAERRGGAERRTGAALHGTWWPTAALAAVPWSSPAPVLVREMSDGIASEVLLLPPETSRP